MLQVFEIFSINDGKKGTVSVALAAMKLLNQRVVPYSFHQHVRFAMILTHSPSKLQGPLLRSICQHRESMSYMVLEMI